jgi:hypothetical protein
VRTLIHEVVADIDDAAAEIVLVVHWIGGVHVNRRPTWTPGETTVTRCSQTFFEKKMGLRLGADRTTPK